MVVLHTRQLVGPAEAARRLNVTPERIRQLARAQILESIELSDGRRVYTAEALDDLAQRRADRSGE